MKELQREIKSTVSEACQTLEDDIEHKDKTRVYDRVKNTIRFELIKMVCLMEEQGSSRILTVIASRKGRKSQASSRRVRYQLQHS